MDERSADDTIDFGGAGARTEGPKEPLPIAEQDDIFLPEGELGGAPQTTTAVVLEPEVEPEPHPEPEAEAEAEQGGQQTDQAMRDEPAEVAVSRGSDYVVQLEETVDGKRTGKLVTVGRVTALKPEAAAEAAAAALGEQRSMKYPLAGRYQVVPVSRMSIVDVEVDTNPRVTTARVEL